jgi:hypothetical protein
MRSCDAVRELIPWYVNGTLSTGEARQVAAHLAECGQCRDELAQLMLLNVEVRRAIDSAGGMTPGVRKDVLSKTTGKTLASFDVGSFLLGFSFGANYRKGRIPIRSDLRVLGRKIRLISPQEEVQNE